MDITVTAMAGRRNNLRFLKPDTVPDESLPIAEKFNTVIEIFLIGLLTFMPFAFGVVHHWSQEVVVVISGCMVLTLLLRQMLLPRLKFFTTPAYIAVLAFLAIAAFEVVPLPAGLVSIISPHTTALKSGLLYGGVSSEPQAWKTTLSFYANSTKASLRLALAIAGIFFVVVNVFNTPERIKRLLRAIVCVGAAVAVLAVLQDVFGNGKIYWFIETPLKADAGPFVNHSHFGQFMNLSIGAALALLFIKLSADFGRGQARVADIFEYFDSAKARGLWLLAAMISVSAATVFISLTRGGMISMLFAISFTVFIGGLKKKFRRHGWIIVAIALVSLLCILYTGFDTVYNRFASLGKFDDYKTRLEVLRDILSPVHKFIIWGTGLGTYSVVYPMFQTVKTGLKFVYAENEYAQLIEEMGLMGFLALLSFGSIICVSFIRAIKTGKSSVGAAVYGLGFGVIAILVHSFSDFGQHLPANTALTVIFCGLIIVLGKSGKAFDFSSNDSARKIFCVRSLRIMLLLICAVVFGWSVIGADNARLSERYWQKAERIREQIRTAGINNTDERKFRTLIAYSQAAVEYQPENVRYRQWYNTYRWWDITRKSTSLSSRDYGQACRIVADLKNARLAAPTYGPIYCLLGQMQRFVLLEPVGEDNIEKGFMLEPNDELTLFTAGYVDILNGRIDESLVKFKKSVDLGGIFFEQMVRTYLNRLDRPDLVIDLAGKDIKRLRYAEKLLKSNKSFAAAAKQCHQKLISVMKDRARSGAADVYELVELGRYYRDCGNSVTAAKYYKMALTADYDNYKWRLEFAVLLADKGNIREAAAQCRICLRIKPGYRAAKNLLGELALRPETIKK